MMKPEDLELKIKELSNIREDKNFAKTLQEYNVIQDSLGCPYMALERLEDYYKKMQGGFK